MPLLAFCSRDAVRDSVASGSLNLEAIVEAWQHHWRITDKDIYLSCSIDKGRWTRAKQGLKSLDLWWLQGLAAEPFDDLLERIKAAKWRATVQATRLTF